MTAELWTEDGCYLLPEPGPLPPPRPVDRRVALASVLVLSGVLVVAAFAMFSAGRSGASSSLTPSSHTAGSVPSPQGAVNLPAFARGR